ncbi:uncharacterized protein [Aegilops tauschii subsp. strangulata]|nr:uncharacterized protein LOC120974882 isoform X2 [Aegilops tauschii subsp. strangulata]XP_044329970.1 uncharacterized protein LOC123051223 isoform X2 [Triticum aestivum]XP_044329971.1 uncharacterized protein LOC123051223 isoform X2 [Triticum aestivum]
MGTEMKSSAERLEALAKEYPGYIMELLAHVLDNDNLTVKYIPEDIKALFETPSGFAIDSGYLYDINIDYTGIQTIWVHCGNKDSADFFLWRKGFLKLDNKSTAIRPDGIDSSLTKLIKKECDPGHILLVGESKYKEAIESNLGIPCRCDEAAEELMWGLQNLLYDLVPEDRIGVRRAGPQVPQPEITCLPALLH